MAELIFSFNAVMPVFLIVFLGIVLKRTGMIDSHFVRMSSRLVFNITIPALIFINLAKSDLAATFQGGMIIIGVSVVVISFLLLWIFTGRISDIRSRGSFIQVSFRSNFAILGLALLHNLYGDPAIAPASVLLTFIMPLFNILSLVILIRYRPGNTGRGSVNFLLEVLKNPLVIAAAVSVPFSLLQVEIPVFFDRTVSYLASLTMPLALLGIGGSMNFTSLKRELGLTAAASLIKIAVIPAIGTGTAALAGFRGQDLGILFILFASPTAIVSFIMAEALDSNSELAAGVIMLSTLLSVLTLGAGIFILKSFQLI